MSEVLSQSQIDALLNAVHSGEKNLEPSQEQTEKKYRKYDFTTPRKFTKDHIKMLNGIFDNYFYCSSNSHPVLAIPATHIDDLSD